MNRRLVVFAGEVLLHAASWGAVFAIMGPDVISTISPLRWGLFGSLVCLGLAQPWRRGSKYQPGSQS
jgi:hypothetical protein